MRSKFMICTVAALAASCSAGDDSASETLTGTTSSTTAVATGSTATSTTAMSTTMPSATSDTSSVSTGSESTTSASGAPFFISFSTNVGQITEGEAVIFTAIVSDPDGFDDIAGGILFTEDGAFSYGPFVSAGQEGTYSITVTWAAINQVTPIEFERFNFDRMFRAEFFDKEANKVTKNVSITLHCDGGGSCGGICTDLQKDGGNCGACGKSCDGGCSDAKCLPVFGECIMVTDGFATCDEYCESVAAQCVTGGCSGSTFKGYNGISFCANDEIPTAYMDPCSAPQTWGPSRNVIRCCCSDT
ncbi:MAG: hypothetical protein R3B09_09005 [Nannocystaceae bacterium]